MRQVRPSERVVAWRPAIAGIAEVFHARFLGHAYPAHTHDTWTLLIVDDGAIRYDLDRHRHDAAEAVVTLLPPHMAHDGRAATDDGFRKRVLYLDGSVLGPDLIGASVGMPSLVDPLLRQRIDQLHRTLTDPADAFVAESRLAFVAEGRLVFVAARLRRHLGQRHVVAAPGSPAGPDVIAGELRDLLDANALHGISLRRAAEILHADPSQLVRAFTRAYGLPPHRYLTGRRIDSAPPPVARRPAAERGRRRSRVPRPAAPEPTLPQLSRCHTHPVLGLRHRGTSCGVR